MGDTNRLVGWCLLGAMFLPESLSAQESVQLRYRFSPGEKLTYQVETKQESTIRTGLALEPIQKMTTRIQAQVFDRVISVQDGLATLEVGMDRFNAKHRVGNDEFPIPGLDSVTQIRMLVKKSALGEVTEPTIHQPEQLSEQLQTLAQSLRHSVSQNSLVFPEKPLNQGESWIIEDEVPEIIPGANSIKMKRSTQFILLELSQKEGVRYAKIQSETKLSLQAELVQGGIPLTADIEGTGSGENLFSIDQGRLITTKAKCQVKGKIATVSGGKQTEIQSALVVNLKMELK